MLEILLVLLITLVVVPLHIIKVKKRCNSCHSTNVKFQQMITDSGYKHVKKDGTPDLRYKDNYYSIDKYRFHCNDCDQNFTSWTNDSSQTHSLFQHIRWKRFNGDPELTRLRSKHWAITRNSKSEKNRIGLGY